MKTGVHERTYRIWSLMKDRCSNPNTPAYKLYGGRGIGVCPSWVESFAAFLSDVGEIPNGLTIDRIDNDGWYCPLNIRLATPMQQANNRRSNRILSCNGMEMTLAEWSRETGIGVHTISARLRYGWSAEDALAKSVRGFRPRRQLTLNGETHTIKEWSDIIGIPKETLCWRLGKSGWTIERILTEPSHNTGLHGKQGHVGT